MHVVPFAPSHLEGLVLQPHQRVWQGRISADHARILTEGGRAWSGIAADGRVLGCAGVLGRDGGRGLAWALLGEGFGGAAFVGLHRAVAGALPALGYRRIEAHVSPAFQQGRRWAEMLGFRCEGLMRAFLDDDAGLDPLAGPEGRDVLLYARVMR